MTTDLTDNNSKVCVKCATKKTLSDFHRQSRSGGWRSECKQCRARIAKTWRQDNPDKIRGYNSIAKESGKYRDWRLRKCYGLTLAEFEQLERIQGGRCAICGLIPQGCLNVDHDHDTDEVRGLLCAPCNMAIGLLRDNPEIIKAAAEYLERR